MRGRRTQYIEVARIGIFQKQFMLQPLQSHPPSQSPHKLRKTHLPDKDSRVKDCILRSSRP
ncbi:hypothetical protein JHK82_016095 [Glycine max]|nr:hypothetical protein JHK82_016095 [Glycine max]